MANNQPNVDTEIDAELDDIANKVPGLREELDKNKPTAEEEQESEDKESEEDPEPEEEEKSEEKSEEEAESESDEEEKEAEEEESDEDEPTRPTRPEKYIPIDQYVDEKKKWKGTEAQKDKRIKELEAIVNGQVGTKVTEEKVKAYAEKHNLDLDQARAEIDRIRDIQEIFGEKSEKTEKTEEEKGDDAPALSDEDRELIEQGKLAKAEKLFKAEFDKDAVPVLKDMFPHATPVQLEKAKAEMAKLASTKPYLDKPLDVVAFRNKSMFEKIFVQPRKGPENGRQGADKGKQSYTADDFKGGKTNFAVLDELSSEEADKIINDMDIATYDKYSHFISQNQPLVINRGGRKLKQR